MRHALIPLDGHWHNLPHPDVVEIEGPTALVEINIQADGIGRVRSLFTDWRSPPLSVPYRCAGDERD